MAASCTQGTVEACSPFSAEQAAAELRKAMKGLGTDEAKIIEVMAKHNNQQRQEIALSFKTQYGKELKAELKSELGGRFEDVVLAMLEKPVNYDARQLKEAIKGLGTDEGTLIEILCSRSNAQIQAIKQAYKTLFKSDLEKDVISDTSGHFKRLLVSQLSANREENPNVDQAKAVAEAKELFDAGANKFGTDESTFNRILSLRSYPQLVATFDAYRANHGREIEKDIKSETSGFLEEGYLAIVTIARNTPEYFAERLYKSMKGAGTKDKVLIRCVVSRSEGTVFPRDPFDPEGAAAELRKAMKGFGTDEDAIIEVMSTHTTEQLAEIELAFKQQYGKDLRKDLKSEIGGKFEDLVLALFEKHEVYDVKEIHRAIKGLGTDEKVLLEILLTSDNVEIEGLKEEYKKQFKSDLEKDIMKDTSGHFRRLLVSVLAAHRDESDDVDEDLAIKEAKELFEAGADKVGTDESTFNRVFCTRNSLQLLATFNAYKSIYGKDIEEVIKKETSGALQDGLVAIVRIMRNTQAYFAERLYKSMKGIGSKDSDLIRIVVTRRELDLEQIKYEFLKAYGKPLENFIKDDTSGDYRKLLLALCKETDLSAAMKMKKLSISQS